MHSPRLFCLCVLSLLAAVTPVHSAQAGPTRAVRVSVTAEFDSGVAYFDILVNDDKDLFGIVYTTPTLPEPVRLTYGQIVNPAGPRAAHGGVIITWKKERPAVIIVADKDRFDRRSGGEITLKYLHNGKDKDKPRFKTLPMRLVREGDTWKILTDDHSTEIRSLCFREKTYWGFTVGAERHEINRRCPKS